MNDEQQAAPDTMDIVTETLAAWRAANRPWPRQFPPGPRDAAHFWIERQEPQRPREKPYQVPVNSGHKENTQRWEDPYTLRIQQSLRSFLTHNAEQQRYILAAIEDKIPYRGEDNRTPHDCFDGRTLFQNIVHETELMRSMPRDEYIQRVRDKAKQVTRGLQA